MKFKEPVAGATEGNAARCLYAERRKQREDRERKQKEGQTRMSCDTRESAVNKTGIIRQSRPDLICASALLRFYLAASCPL